MNHLLKITCYVFLSVILLAILHACKKTTLPVLTTFSVTDIVDTGAIAGGNISDDGGSEVTFRGICYGSTHYPTINDEQINDEEFIGRSFLINISGLFPGTDYYLRAFATNSVGTSYGNEVVFRTFLADVEGNLYKTVEIGNQDWMAENLRTTKYNDGTAIPKAPSYPGAWLDLKTNPAYCWFNYDSIYKKDYGALYKWGSVYSGELCPSGWHVPSEEDWHQLMQYLDPNTIEEPYYPNGPESLIAGGKLKETGTEHWWSPNTGATNEFGFTALPGGYRLYEGSFMGMGEFCWFWSRSDTILHGNALTRLLYFENSKVIKRYYHPWGGYSVRCLKN